jgi:hypothetical protein
MANEINKKNTRRKFITWGVISAAALAAFKFIKPSANKPQTDIASLPPQKKKITNKELQNWIKK